jgi:hypothetical protein
MYTIRAEFIMTKFYNIQKFCLFFQLLGHNLNMLKIIHRKLLHTTQTVLLLRNNSSLIIKKKQNGLLLSSSSLWMNNTIKYLTTTTPPSNQFRERKNNMELTYYENIHTKEKFWELPPDGIIVTTLSDKTNELNRKEFRWVIIDKMYYTLAQSNTAAFVLLGIIVLGMIGLILYGEGGDRKPRPTILSEEEVNNEKLKKSS